MFRRIVVALDGSSQADRALATAIDLARQAGAKLTLLSVLPIHPVAIGPSVVLPVSEEERTALESALAKGVALARGRGVSEVDSVLREGLVVDELLAAVDTDPPDLLVMGSRGLSAAGRLFLGSVSDALVHHAPCAVLIERAPKPPTEKTGRKANRK